MSSLACRGLGSIWISDQSFGPKKRSGRKVRTHQAAGEFQERWTRSLFISIRSILLFGSPSWFLLCIFTASFIPHGGGQALKTREKVRNTKTGLFLASIPSEIRWHFSNIYSWIRLAITHDFAVMICDDSRRSLAGVYLYLFVDEMLHFLMYIGRCVQFVCYVLFRFLLAHALVCPCVLPRSYMYIGLFK